MSGYHTVQWMFYFFFHSSSSFFSLVSNFLSFFMDFVLFLSISYMLDSIVSLTTHLMVQVLFSLIKNKTVGCRQIQKNKLNVFLQGILQEICKKNSCNLAYYIEDFNSCQFNLHPEKRFEGYPVTSTL